MVFVILCCIGVILCLLCRIMKIMFRRMLLFRLISRRSRSVRMCWLSSRSSSRIIKIVFVCCSRSNSGGVV